MSTLKWGPVNSVFSLTFWKDHSILRQKNESPTNKLFRLFLFAEIASDTWFTLFFWKTVRVSGNTKLNWVVINELTKTYRIDSNKRRPGMSAILFPPERYRFVHLSRLMWLIRSGKRLRNNFFSRWLFLFLWLFNKIIESKWKYVAKSIRWSFRGIQHLRSGIGLFETGLKPSWKRKFLTRNRVWTVSWDTLWRAVLKWCGFRVSGLGFGFRWAGSLVSCGRKVDWRKKRHAVSKISGFVWTRPKKRLLLT